jgi:hypothetical protein
VREEGRKRKEMKSFLIAVEIRRKFASHSSLAPRQQWKGV